jgi:hypothetical protein
VPGRGFDRGGFVMRWKPVVVQSEKLDGSLVVTVGASHARRRLMSVVLITGCSTGIG